MKKFLTLYHAPVSAHQQMASATPEQARAGMEAWMTWAGKAAAAIVDFGMPLDSGQRLGASSSEVSNATVTGYSILQADSMEGLKELLKDHPHFRVSGSSIEIFEGLSPPGM